MRALDGTRQKWLKCFHLIFVSLWLAGGISLLLMQSLRPENPGLELYGIDRARRFIDDFIIIPGALGSLLTGFLYSCLTSWGFFKQHWITVKWVITICGVLFGTFALGPWLNSMGPISERLGEKALADPEYLRALSLNTLGASFQISSLLLAAFISVLKPWRNRSK